MISLLILVESYKKNLYTYERIYILIYINKNLSVDADFNLESVFLQ